ncbi:hypothetical protein Nepgr_025081 [Nepenthes gracilis]|uniref:RING-type E3 ubiquitin transferase n=1 Tax=Nepenthes gracilis TaxID=150966 RepID=A0AAD3T432_NEPGR|nr:hypothetical protein Nepgr_025081 [Nepenthes gracilis]
MQGQESAVGSVPNIINFDYGSTSSNAGMDQQICWNNLCNPAESRHADYRVSGSGSDAYISPLSQPGRNLSRWSIGASNSSDPQNLINHDEQMLLNGWPSSVVASSSIVPRLETQQYESASIISRNNVNLTPNSNQIDNGASFGQCSNSGSTSQNYDLNVEILGRVGGEVMECSNSSKSGGLENKLVSSASSSSDPFASSSGSGGFLVEEDGVRPGSSSDGPRLSRKRKVFEANAGQSSCCGSIWPAVSSCCDVGGSAHLSTPSETTLSGSSHPEVDPHLGLGIGGTSNGHDSNAAGGAESSQRNYLIGMNFSSHEESIPPNNAFLLGSNNGNSDVPSDHQPLRLMPVNPPLDLMSPPPPDTAAPRRQPAVLRLPSLRHHMQALRWNGVPGSRPGSSSTAAAAVPGGRDAPLNEDSSSRTMPRNISEHPMFTPVTEMRNSAQNLSNWSVTAGNITMPSNVASSSHVGPSSSSHSSSGPNRVSHRHTQSQYSQRLAEYVHRSLLSSAGSEIAVPGRDFSAHRSVPVTGQEVVLPSSSRNQGHNRSYSSRSASWIERQGEGVIGIPYSWRTLAAAGEGRSRLVSEIRNVLDIMRRGELQFEDVMNLDQTVLFGMADIHDQHRDMRLDVDNMSYEELLSLEERIGNVCTGLNEETVLSRMQQYKYISTMRDVQTEVELCCICREEYNDWEDLGILDCGHDFHTDCIKQWLAQKNLCPICKTTALATT